MQQRISRAAAFLVVLGSMPSAAQSQVLNLALDPTSNTLSVEGNSPTLVVEQPFTIRVAGITTDPGWTPVVGGLRVPFTAADASGASFELATVTAAIQVNAAGRAALTIDPATASVRFAGDPPFLNVTTDGAAAPPVGDCNIDQTVDITRPAAGANRVHLMFNADGMPLRPMPTDLDENDAIVVTMVLPCAGSADYTVQLEGTFADGSMNVLSSGALENLSELRNELTAAGRDTFYMGTFGPFQPPQVTVIIKRGDEEVRRHVLRVVKNYIAAIRLGVGQSNLRFSDFDLRSPADGGDANVITDLSDPDGEPRYFVSVVWYGWHFWDSGAWNGRDLSEQPGLIDRLNPYVGVGLKNPGHEYLAGLTFELARGVDVVWGVHIARTERLVNGATEGAEFDGEAGDLPTQHDWKAATNYWGVSADLETAANVLLGILGGS